MAKISDLGLDENKIDRNFKVVKSLCEGPYGNTDLICDDEGN
uniref:Uncharacterized protein n=1 Tax=Theileria annulata TaxID=5874 RepID=A0A3B0N7S0_THEAN